jgi:predicted HicB family RNase H-like nuclease
MAKKFKESVIDEFLNFDDEAPADKKRTASPDAAAVEEQQPQHEPRLIKKPETKTKRLQLLIKPSLYNKIKTNAQINGVSVNQFMETAAEQLINQINAPAKGK